MSKLLTGLVVSAVSVSGIIAAGPAVARELGEIEVHRSSGHTISSSSSSGGVHVSSQNQRRRGRGSRTIVNTNQGSSSVSSLQNSSDVRREDRRDDRREDRREDRGLEIEVHRSSGH